MILDIIINVFNNEKNILNIYTKIEEELKNISHRFIFVDDASTDKSLEVLKNIQSKNEANVKIIELSKQYGKDTSIYAGLINSTHDLVCIYDTTLQANVSYITKMYELLKKNKEYDQVCMTSTYEEKNIINKNKVKLLNLLYSLNVDNNKTYYRMMKRNVVNSIIEITKNYQFTSYSFELLGFNTYYMKFDNSKIDNSNISKYVVYSKKPYNILKSINLILLTILIIIFLMTIFKIIKISTILLLILIILFNIINILIMNISFKFLSKEKTYFTIKEKIGFDDNIL